MENFNFTLYLLSALWGMSFAALLKLAWDFLHIGSVKAKEPDKKDDEPKENHPKGIRLFDVPGKTLEAEKMTIAQASPGDCDGGALVILTTHDGETEFNLTALYQNSEGKVFYDRQAFQVRENKVVKQIGVFTYHCKGDYMATVPVVDFYEKEANDNS